MKLALGGGNHDGLAGKNTVTRTAGTTVLIHAKVSALLLSTGANADTVKKANHLSITINSSDFVDSLKRSF